MKFSPLKNFRQWALPAKVKCEIFFTANVFKSKNFRNACVTKIRLSGKSPDKIFYKRKFPELRYFLCVFVGVLWSWPVCVQEAKNKARRKEFWTSVQYGSLKAWPLLSWNLYRSIIHSFYSSTTPATFTLLLLLFYSATSLLLVVFVLNVTHLLTGHVQVLV